ncbi:penicillin-binding protein 2 [Patescibacteria group bacterium]|nr:MAG: penicillin-binding protein 2 [Patescibacteria group bacterium]
MVPTSLRNDDPSHPFRLQEDGRFGRVGAAEGIGQDAGILLEHATAGEGISRVGTSIPSRRYVGAATGASILLIGLLARCVDLQVVRAAAYRALAEGNRVQERVTDAPRGIVADRHGNVLIRNVSSFMLTLTASALPTDEAQRDLVLSRAAELAGVTRTDIDLLLSDASRTDLPVPVRRGIPYESAMRLAVETSRLPGFALDTSISRQYDTDASSLSHVLGYVGRMDQGELDAHPGYRRTDDIGKAGIERGAEALLRGLPGRQVVEVDALGNELTLVSDVPSVPGANLILAIDADLQSLIERRLEETFARSGTSRASVVALDPRSGAVRALVSLPAYDSNSFALGISHAEYERLVTDEDQPLFPRAVSGEFPSGSVFKPFVSYAALKEGVVDERTSFLSTGGISIGPWYFPDWKAGGHGTTDVRKAIADSVNTFFYVVGGGLDQVTGLGVERITDYARMFGFGKRTGIELPGEADGFLPTKEWKLETKGERWFVGDTYHLSIGQGDLLATPLQVAAATAAIANGGRTVRPHLIEGVDGPTVPGQAIFASRVPSQTFDPALVRVVQEGMRQGVTKGSSRGLAGMSIALAGKTGTAQTPGDNPTHAWWTGYGPYGSPTLAVTILIEHGGEGSSAAIPIARDIFDWWSVNGE